MSKMSDPLDKVINKREGIWHIACPFPFCEFSETTKSRSVAYELLDAHMATHV